MVLESLHEDDRLAYPITEHFEECATDRSQEIDK